MSSRTTRSSLDFLSAEMPNNKKTKAALQSSLDKMKNEKDEVAQKLEAIEKKYSANIQTVRSENEKLLANMALLKTETEKRIEQLISENAANVQALEEGHVNDMKEIKVEHSNVIAKKMKELETLKEMSKEHKASFDELNNHLSGLQTNHNTLASKYQMKKERVIGLEKEASKLVEWFEYEKKKTVDYQLELKEIKKKFDDLELLFKAECEKGLQLKTANDEQVQIIDELKEKLATFEKSSTNSTEQKETCSNLLKENKSLRKDVEYYKDLAERHLRSKKLTENSKKTIVKRFNNYKDAFIASSLMQDGIDLAKFDSRPYQHQANVEKRHVHKKKDRSRSRSPKGRPSKRPFAPHNRQESQSREFDHRDPRKHHHY